MNPGLPRAGTAESAAPKPGAEDIVHLELGERIPRHRLEPLIPSRWGESWRKVPYRMS
jgi:hypothetical protein